MCTAPYVGMETDDILDSQLSASTGYPLKARLDGSTAWCSDQPDDVGGHIQVNKTVNIFIVGGVVASWLSGAVYTDIR